MSAASRPGVDLRALPSLPRDPDGPVFRAPWEAAAFALAVSLHRKGLYTWPEWTAQLSAQIKAAQLAGDPDCGDTYYQHWLAALETLVVAKGVTSEAGLADLAGAWDRAARATPHGRPIVLGADTRGHHDE